ncbi:extracellular solute-binding protein [Conexibacter sp. DBS9H8]|uniref:extracellular solute-binding protein n=1 Tax=Conexibacter sp. DBS9H8 TaxID=2937801 RepID=UPI00200C294F|nr:extracellular solute-binding protein [Conexibacter sp. DBS9H8]
MHPTNTYADRRAGTQRRRRSTAVLAGTAAVLALAGCGASASATSHAVATSTAPPAATATGTAASGGAAAGNASATHSGNVVVLSAGSLDTVLTDTVGPAFHRATGYTLVDTSGGSGTLAADIKNKVDAADVFISAAPSINATLEGGANGNWVSWYATFAYSPYVLGYYPRSRFAKALRTRPWYAVVTLPGFRLGRTNPTQDPGGVLAVAALKTAARRYHLPTLARIAADPSTEYEETAEQAGIENGQLDAAFMYEADAISQHSPYVPLTGAPERGYYTITLLNRAAHTAAAEAFIRFLLSPAGQRAFTADRFGVVSPARVAGSGVPAALGSLLGK